MTIRQKAICTIVAKNYLAYARTLCQSFLKVHGDAKLFVLIVDDFADYLDPANEPFEVITLTELGIPDLPSLCFKYNVTELCTAVKSHFLDYLLHQRGINHLLYLDPDIFITSSLHGLFERLDSADIVLTPHLDTDYPDDNMLPDDAYILRAGVFNLGFIGINGSGNARAFLNWWKAKLSNKCLSNVTNGYFVDQKFVDLVPALFENYYIEKDVGYNVAYWNLHSRHLSCVDNVWKCNDRPLHFFHFSGYDPQTPDSIVTPKYIPSKLCRPQLSQRPDLQPLFSTYRSLLIKNGAEEVKQWPYTYGYFKTGEPIPNELRIYYRNCPDQWLKYENPFESDALKRAAFVMRMRQRKMLSPVIWFYSKYRSLVK